MYQFMAKPRVTVYPITLSIQEINNKVNVIDRTASGILYEQFPGVY